MWMNSVEFSSKQIKRLLGLRGNKCETSACGEVFGKKKEDLKTWHYQEISLLHKMF